MGRQRSHTGPGQSPHWTAPPAANELWEKYSKEENTDEATIQESFIRHATKTLARSSFNMDNVAAYNATAHSVRDHLIDRWNLTQQCHSRVDAKRVYYMSLEFLIGRTLDNALLNLSMKDNYQHAIQQVGFRLEDLIHEETDAALGNGGLGRLAACFMDSLATLDYPAWGYGLRYEYGIFQQKIIDGYQAEYPDYWLTADNPWQLTRLDVTYDVLFRGSVEKYTDAKGRQRWRWDSSEKVVAVANDYPIPGCGTQNCINIRLWSSKPKKEFDFASFNDGNYDKSVEEQKSAANITSVLYPNDNHLVGKVLRLKQQYFFVSATLQDIIRRFKKSAKPWSDFPNQVSIQLNDTHPTLSIVELQRILLDEEGLDWDEAWNIVSKTYSYTNHTVLPEALERWSVPLVSDLLPRHMSIIFELNLYFLQKVEKKFPDDRDRLRRMSIIEEGHPQFVRMAYLAVVGSHHVNGVAELHSELVKTTILKDFVAFYGAEKFVNVTNGVTPRRWLHQANPSLSKLITDKLSGKGWLKDLSKLSELKKYATDPAFQKLFMDIKFQNKVRLAEYIKENLKIDVSPNALFDVQCKRLHEYKRQHMNIWGVIHRYERLKKLSKEELRKEVPRVVFFAGKAAPGYYIAKLIIKLINNVAAVINKDPATSEYLKLIFIPNYNVSVAEILIPASDISQHISTAGTEASGTSNMKFVLNGGLILGTVDGANIEIGEEVGEENIFFFGALAPEVDDIRYKQLYRHDPMDEKLAAVVKSIRQGTYGDAGVFEPLIETLDSDKYIISKDFTPYLQAMDKVDAAYRDTTGWAKKCIIATASMGKFSSDRSINDYAQRIWNIKPVAASQNSPVSA
ncbi:glycosyl transferase [Fimicolochytrium jonesii]|uniref:glycosyl transferase n=1 Tax=Fimicolochytrium jonesii TaxID=1396493 RepID=UPI0022FED123|nr:glycosyl transferase [Fimicolochytrium jonesii]KAI8817116.1 glycosyl transferase [Fimicolochytrium jonesii]